MNTKHFLVLTLAALLLLSLVAWIWRPDNNLGGKVPLSWLSDGNPARAEQISTFNAENPGIHLFADSNGGAEKIILQCSSGVGPDVFDVNGDNIGMYVEAGVLMDLTEEAAKLGFSAKEDAWPSSEKEITYLGKQYSYPCNAGAGILIYNKNVFDYYGVPYPKGTLTWEEFVALSQKVNSISTGKTPGGTIYAISGAIWVVFFDSLRGEFFSEDGAIHIRDNENLRKAFQWHKDMLYKYRLAPTSYELKSMSSQGGWGSWGLNQFAANRYAMAFTGNWSIIAFGRTYNQQIKDLKAAGIDPEKITDPMQRPIRLGCTMIPKFAGLPASYRTTCRSAGINVNSPHKEEALKFLQYLAGPSYSRLVNEYSDYLPGNPKYADTGEIKGATELAAIEMHEATKEALKSGYSPRSSPFLLTSDVYRVLNDQINRMESDPNIDVQTLLDTAQDQLDVLLRRNLERNPDMRETLRVALWHLAHKVMNAQVNRRNTFIAILFLAPNLLGFLAFTFGPILMSLVGSFTTWNLRPGVPFRFIGIQNYIDLFSDPNFYFYLYNTVYFMLGMPIGIIGSLALAVYLSQKFEFKGPRKALRLAIVSGILSVLIAVFFGLTGSGSLAFCFLALGVITSIGFYYGSIGYRTFLYLPYFTSGAGTILLWMQLYNPDFGAINQVIIAVGDFFGWHIKPPGWLISTKSLLGFLPFPEYFNNGGFGLGAREAMIIMGVWGGIGGNTMVLYLAAISNIPPDLYEAADIDGANGWHRFRYITLPQLAPTTFFIVVMGIIGGLQGGFETARLMTNGGPAGTTTTLSYYIYTQGFERLDLGYGAAVAWVLFIIIMGITLINWRYGNRDVAD